jgi:hypothetical protein
MASPMRERPAKRGQMATTVRTGMAKMAPLNWRQCTLKNDYFKALFILILKKIELLLRLILASFKSKPFSFCIQSFLVPDLANRYPACLSS